MPPNCCWRALRWVLLTWVVRLPADSAVHARQSPFWSVFVRNRQFYTARQTGACRTTACHSPPKFGGKPGYTVDGGGTELYGLVRMFTEYTCRHVAVGGLYAVCCSPHTPGFVALRRWHAGHASPVLYRLLLFYSVSHAIKKAVQKFAPLTKHFRLNQSLLVQVKSSIFSKVSADNSLVPTLPPK